MSASDKANDTLINPMRVAQAWHRITAERTRQVSEEGWTAEHDDAHDDGSLLRAAVSYLHFGTDACSVDALGVPLGWPWEKQWWKPQDRAQNLIRAGALCLAERDRCVRAGRPTGPADHKLGLCLMGLSSALTEPMTVRDVVAQLPYSAEELPSFKLGSFSTKA